MTDRCRMMLNLNIGCLENPNMEHVGVVGSAMLWPDPADSAIRDGALQAWKVDGKIRHDAMPLPATRKEQRQLLEIVQAAGPIAPFQRAACSPFWFGVGAGFLLQAALKDNGGAKGRSNFAELKAKLAENGFFKNSPVTVKTIDNHIWPKYRPVAALWASYTAGSAADPQEATFPCTPGTFLEFLAGAESFRKLGESTRFRQSRLTVLEPGKSVVVPECIAKALPKATLQFA